MGLVSVPATAVYHPVPDDYWRWTQEGLRKVLAGNGDWSRIDLHPGGGTMACFGYLVAFYASAAIGERAVLAPLRLAVIAAINTVFGALDRVVPLHYPRKYTLIANFLAVVRKR